MTFNRGDQPPEPDIIELGHDEPELPAEPVERRRFGPLLAPALAGLGGLGLFASLFGEWATITFEPDFLTDLVITSLASMGGWGTGWIVGVLALATAAGVSLFGPAPVRAAARAVGLALAGALAGLLVAITVNLSQHGDSWLTGQFGEQFDVTLGRGLYAGYGALALIAAALWLARPPVNTGPDPVEPPEPGQVTVAPVEPLAYPDRRYEWR